MPQEKITIARPYAEAVLGRAQETDTLDRWSEMLGLLSAIIQIPELVTIIDNPEVPRDQVEATLLEISGTQLSEEGQNLLRILAHNRRLPILPDIAALYEQRKRECQGTLQVQVLSAYVLGEEQEHVLADALKERLQRDIEISSEQDPSLIGGVLIRAGDLVIDGSVRGQLHQLANQLRF
jgi:F-type H+-transporting ATPase subunit delta